MPLFTKNLLVGLKSPHLVMREGINRTFAKPDLFCTNMGAKNLFKGVRKELPNISFRMEKF